MKIWEAICKEDTNNRVKPHTKEKIRSWLYANRILPCDVELSLFQENGDIGFRNCNCNKYFPDCLKCLDEYLDLEDMHNRGIDYEE